MTLWERISRVAYFLWMLFWVFGLVGCLYGLTLCRKLLRVGNRPALARVPRGEPERVPVYVSRRD